MVKCVLKKTGTFSFVGVDMNNPGSGFGTVEYWINLRVPMEQALRLYKARNVLLIFSMDDSKFPEIDHAEKALI